MKDTMFERYGGFASVSRIVSDLYDKLLDSASLSGYFVDVDTASLIDHQTRMVAAMMGGPAAYTNEHLRRVHQRHQIEESHFTEFLGIFRETLEDHDVDESDIAAMVSLMAARREYVVQ